jgi:AraC-like DNA-binding protein
MPYKSSPSDDVAGVPSQSKAGCDDLSLASAKDQSVRIRSSEQLLRSQILEAGSLGKAARKMGQTSVAMLRYCKETIGQTPGRFIREAKLNGAARAIALGKRRILEIALDNGYNSQAAFSRAFNRYFGVPPALMRRRGLQEQDRSEGSTAHQDETVALRRSNLTEISGVGTEYIGDYNAIQPRVIALVKWAGRQGLLKNGFVAPTIVYNEHPWIKESSKLKAWIVLPVDHAGAPEQGILPIVVPGGPVYETVFRGSYAEVLGKYNRMLRQLTQRGSPCFCHEAAIITFHGDPATCAEGELQCLARVRICDDCQ